MTGSSPPVGYPEPALHESISDIIRRHSSNRTDIRRVALEGIDLSRAHRLLDLGCGFGFMARALAGRVPSDASIIGVDSHPGNRPAFVAAAAAGGCRGSYLCRTLVSHLDFPARTFDLVIASYSLYFFPAVIPEVARVLQPGGTFVAVTHSEADFSGLLGALGVASERSALRALIRGFSAENGADRLRPHFTTVEQHPYPNRLTFRAGDMADFLTLIRFKAPHLIPAGGPAGDPTEIEEQAREVLRYTGSLVIEKDDAIFHCTGPRP
jgi:ubiquinone/menaquinone biosynthesis C-methylase UbiE